MSKITKKDIVAAVLLAVFFVAMMISAIFVALKVRGNEDAINDKIAGMALQELSIETDNYDMELIGCHKSKSEDGENIYIYTLDIDQETYIFAVWRDMSEVKAVKSVGKIGQEEKKWWEKILSNFDH